MNKPGKSKANLREWIRDRIIFLAMVIFVFGAAMYISADKLFGHSIWLHPAREFSLLISLIGVVSLGYELFLRELTFKQYKDALQEIVNPHAVRLGIEGIYKNRSELGSATSFESLFKNVKREIFIGGSSLLSISTNSRELLKEKILHGINVKLLLMDPHSPVVELITRQGGGKATFLNEIKTSLLLLQKLQGEIESESGASAKGKLLVHTYDVIPSHSFICIDSGEPGGVIVADIGPYLGRSTPRPSMLVVNKKHGIYEYWQEMNDILWGESKAVIAEKPFGPGARTKTLVLASGEGTECFQRDTESWRPAAICQMRASWRSMKGSYWIWVRDALTIEEAKTGTRNQFRVKFDIPAGKEKSIVRADLLVRADDVCHITVNDVGLKQEYGGATYPDPYIIDIEQFTKSGENEIQFELVCYAKPGARAPDDNSAGLIYRLHLEYRE